MSAPEVMSPPDDPTGFRRSLWHLHPGVRSGDQLSPGERAADLVRNGMGSWRFVVLFAVWMATWMVGNGRSGFDPYPWILLNLILSTLAGVQGAILLIAAKRSDQVASETAIHTLDNTEALKTLIEQNTALVTHVAQLSEELHRHLVAGSAGTDLGADPGGDEHRRGR